MKLTTGLPDGLFSSKKNPNLDTFWKLGMENVFFFVASTFRLSPLILEEHNPDSFGILFYAWSRAFANLTEAGCSGTP
jgi:hypothetical protein